MGFFDFLKNRKRKVISERQIEAAEIPILDSEKKFYQLDDYYLSITHEGTAFEHKVITFSERKKTSIPSEHGLYVPEILMLYYCKKYPNPKNGYPGYWWFQYGIRNVGAVYKTLVQRGFLTVNECTNKYELTELGNTELRINAYVHYVHSHSQYKSFTAWDANILLKNSVDKANYKDIVDNKFKEIDIEARKHEEAFMKEFKKDNFDGYKDLQAQDRQLKAMQEADERYKIDTDIQKIIQFWEQIWRKGGPSFAGAFWMFRLPDLYIKARRYDEALDIVNKIKTTRESDCSNKVDKYIENIKDRKNKATIKRSCSKL
jgi:hypothetical protein